MRTKLLVFKSECWFRGIKSNITSRTTKNIPLYFMDHFKQWGLCTFTAKISLAFFTLKSMQLAFPLFELFPSFSFHQYHSSYIQGQNKVDNHNISTHLMFCSCHFSDILTFTQTFTFRELYLFIHNKLTITYSQFCIKVNAEVITFSYSMRIDISF